MAVVGGKNQIGLFAIGDSEKTLSAALRMMSAPADEGDMLPGGHSECLETVVDVMIITRKTDHISVSEGYDCFENFEFGVVF